MRSFIIAIALTFATPALAQDAMSVLYWISGYTGKQAKVQYAMKPMAMVDCKLKSKQLTDSYKWSESLKDGSVLMLQCFGMPNENEMNRNRKLHEQRIAQNVKRMELTRDMLEMIHKRR